MVPLFCDNGAVLMHSDAAAYVGEVGVSYYMIEPYFASLALYFAMKATPDLAAPYAKKWIGWWFDHTDPVTGTPKYHYCQEDRLVQTTSVEGSTLAVNAEDATDSNIACMFMVLWECIKKEGTVWMTPAITNGMAKALNAMTPLRQPDGLTMAKTDWPYKYLQDNIETWKGLKCAQNCFTAMGKPEQNKAYAWHKACGAALKNYYRGDGTWSNHLLGVDEYGAPNMQETYPTLQAQLWPSLFGFDNRGGYKQVALAKPDWQTARMGTDTTDAIMCLTASATGDAFASRRWMDFVSATYENQEGSFIAPFNISHAAQLHYAVTRSGLNAGPV